MMVQNLYEAYTKYENTRPTSNLFTVSYNSCFERQYIGDKFKVQN